MKRFLTITAAAITLLTGSIAVAEAQPGRNDNRYDQRYNNNDHRNDARPAVSNNRFDNNRHNWRKGGRIERADWNRGRRVADWQRRHLQRPARGYEWREVDGNYVMAAVATGLIASIILSH